MARLTPANLRKYQWRNFNFLWGRTAAALFLDMGLGKTIIVLSWIKALFHKNKIDKPVLLIGPIRVIYNVWAQEAANWTHTKSLRFSIVHGNEVERIAALKAPADVYLINPENLVWLLSLFRKRRSVAKWPFSTLVIDESSLFKSVGSKRFGALRHFVKFFEYRVIMSGTPTPNSLLELWPQIFLVDGGERLGNSSVRFKKRFFVKETDPDTGKPSERAYARHVPRKGASNYIYRLINDCAVSMRASDWRKDIPPTVINYVYVDLPKRARALYERMENELFIELERGKVRAVNPAVLSGKCHQIANGAVYSIIEQTGERVWETIHDAKLDALGEIYDATSTPLLVPYWYKPDLARLLDRYPKTPWFSPRNLNTLEKEWNADKHRMVFAHPRSMAHGTNLQKGSGCTIAFFSGTFSYEAYDQLINRIGGARAQRKVMVHHIVARDTVDEAIVLSMKRGARDNQALMGALKDYRAAKQKRR